MKSPLRSKTIQGIGLTLAGSALTALPAILQTAATVDPRIGLAVSLGGAVYAAYGRYKATQPIG